MRFTINDEMEERASEMPKCFANNAIKQRALTAFLVQFQRHFQRKPKKKPYAVLVADANVPEVAAAIDLRG